MEFINLAYVPTKLGFKSVLKIFVTGQIVETSVAIGVVLFEMRREIPLIWRDG